MIIYDKQTNKIIQTLERNELDTSGFGANNILLNLSEIFV